MPPTLKLRVERYGWARDHAHFAREAPHSSSVTSLTFLVETSLKVDVPQRQGKHRLLSLLASEQARGEGPFSRF